MKRILILLIVVCGLLGAGCQSQNSNQGIKSAVRLGLNYGELLEQIERSECEDANDCPKADKIAKIVSFGEQFYAMLDGEWDCETVQSGLDIVQDIVIENGDQKAAFLLVAIRSEVSAICEVKE